MIEWMSILDQFTDKGAPLYQHYKVGGDLLYLLGAVGLRDSNTSDLSSWK